MIVFVLLCGLMTAVAAAAVIWPLVRAAPSPNHVGSDLVVYRDQLAELERDRTEGLIGEAEAAAARVEISRRLLTAADLPQTGLAPASTAAARMRRVAVVTALLTLPFLAGGYLWLGSPNLALRQTFARAAESADQEPVEALVIRTETYLMRNPADGHGWEVLAPVYMQLGRYSDSVSAWRRALALLGESAERDANLGEALTAESNGLITAEAKAAFARATTIDQTLVSARYYLGLAAEQEGDRATAAKLWRDLIAEAPADAQWVADVREALARVESNSASAPGPSARQIAAAANQPPEQQVAMIQSMVERLAGRLKQDGSDVEGWARLVHSYRVLGDTDKALAASLEARHALAVDPDKLQQFNRAIEELKESNAAPSAQSPLLSTAPMPGAPPDHGPAVENMIERLAARMKTNGSDPTGWLMLVRSYLAIHEKDKATAAIASARQALADDRSKLEQFNSSLQHFNIGQ
jgi:cytochrome c-type biogenesis protein CcmH